MSPTTLSGKHASNVRTPLSAMFAAIVMQRVPAGHIWLCARPISLYNVLNVRIRPPERATSPV